MIAAIKSTAFIHSFSVSINPIFGITLQVFTGNAVLIHFYF